MADSIEQTTAAAPQVESNEPTQETADAGLNALQHNIQSKGNNAYYFAHANSKETVRNYGGPPAKLDVDPSEAMAELAVSSKTPITKYAWGDETKSVKLYISDVPEEHGDEMIDLKWEAKSVSVVVREWDGRDRELSLPKLHKEISGAKYRKKGGRVTVTLSKASEEKWFKLQD